MGRSGTKAIPKIFFLNSQAEETFRNPSPTKKGQQVSFHSRGRNRLTHEMKKTMRPTEKVFFFQTTIGIVEVSHAAEVYVKELNIDVVVTLVEVSPAVLSLATLRDDMG